MNLSSAEAADLSGSIYATIAAKPLNNAEIYLAPAFVHIPIVKESNTNLLYAFGGQDCSAEGNGAHTGDISAVMLKDMDCQFVILGHSERRSDYGETSAMVKSKAEKALSEGLHVIICVGETLGQRESGQAKEIVREQLTESLPLLANGENCVIAYEPVWAIGTGKTASTDDVADMHNFIAEFLSSRLALSEHLRIIYGGSVKPDNAAELFALANVSGALIGGASLNADSFMAIAGAAENIKN